jgi:phage terminase large subunit
MTMGRFVNAALAMKHEDERLARLVTFPSAVYGRDPARFCLEVLGFAPTRRQIEILEAVRDHERVAIPAGRKVGKSRTLAALALWWFCMWEDATVVLVAPSERQITEVTFYDLVALFHNSGRCIACRSRNPDGMRPCAHSTCVDGDLSASVRSGLRAGQRRIIGLAPRNAENARGISGPHQLWLIDEASGVARAIYEAADGNRAAGAKLVVAGNPTSRATWFYDACQTFHTIQISATDSPNVVFGRRIVPGLADVGWIQEKREDWGVDDPRYQIEVEGLFPTREAMRLASDEEVALCFERHEMISDLKALDGPLFFGIDPAGGRGGDKSAIVVRRDGVVLEMLAINGATDEIMVHVDVLLRKWRKWPKEPFTVNFDGSSRFGADMADAMRGLKAKDDGLTFHALEMKGDRSKDPALRQARASRLVDAYYLSLQVRLRTDACIPFDETLRVELLYAEFRDDPEDKTTRLISKREIRKALGHSPDLSDALACAFWEGRVLPLSHAAAEHRAHVAAAVPPPRRAEPRSPHEALNEMQRGTDGSLDWTRRSRGGGNRGGGGADGGGPGPGAGLIG